MAEVSKNEHSESIKYLEQAAKMAKDSDPVAESYIYFDMANQYSLMNEKIKSLQYYKECLLRAKNNRDKELMEKLKQLTDKLN